MVLPNTYEFTEDMGCVLDLEWQVDSIYLGDPS